MPVVRPRWQPAALPAGADYGHRLLLRAEEAPTAVSLRYCVPVHRGAGHKRAALRTDDSLLYIRSSVFTIRAPRGVRQTAPGLGDRRGTTARTAHHPLTSARGTGPRRPPGACARQGSKPFSVSRDSLPALGDRVHRKRGFPIVSRSSASVTLHLAPSARGTDLVQATPH